MLNKEQLERLIDIVISESAFRIPGEAMDKEDTDIINHLLTMSGDLDDTIQDLMSLRPSDLSDPDKIETEICQLLRIQDLAQERIRDFNGFKALAYAIYGDTGNESY